MAKKKKDSWKALFLRWDFVVFLFAFWMFLQNALEVMWSLSLYGDVLGFEGELSAMFAWGIIWTYILWSE